MDLARNQTYPIGLYRKGVVIVPWIVLLVFLVMKPAWFSSGLNFRLGVALALGLLVWDVLTLALKRRVNVSGLYFGIAKDMFFGWVFLSPALFLVVFVPIIWSVSK